jgi:HEPN domain-containing protein
MAAFMLHQAVEHALVGLVRVYTGYRFGTHNIDKLLRYANTFTNEVVVLFPKNTKEEAGLFNLLRRAYVDARYREDYTITANEVAVLLRRVEELHKIVKTLCEEKSTELEAVCHY